MTPAVLGCFGSHQSWQVVSCVAGPEADRDGPRLSDDEAELDTPRNPLGGHPRPLFDSSNARWRFEARSTITEFAGPALIGGCEPRQ